MIKCTKFYITENDVKLMREVLKAVTTKKQLNGYDKQSLFRLTKDMSDAIVDEEIDNLADQHEASRETAHFY